MRDVKRSNSELAYVPDASAEFIPGIDKHSTISTESPGKIEKCGWPSNILAAAS